MRAKLPILIGAQGVPQFEQPTFLQQVEQDTGGLDETLSSVDLLLTAAAATSALEDGALGSFALDLAGDTPGEPEMVPLSPAPLVAAHASFIAAGDKLFPTAGQAPVLPGIQPPPPIPKPAPRPRVPVSGLPHSCPPGSDTPTLGGPIEPGFGGQLPTPDFTGGGGGGGGF